MYCQHLQKHPGDLGNLPLVTSFTLPHYLMTKRGLYPSVPTPTSTLYRAVSGVPGDRSRMHTHDYDGSEALDESPDSILSSDPKPLEKHRPPPLPSILSPRESSYPP
ncbi:hypothetical protein Tco_0015448 [Tanacetum coccineum]